MELSNQKIMAFLREELPETEMQEINDHLRNDPLDAIMVEEMAKALEKDGSLQKFNASVRTVSLTAEAAAKKRSTPQRSLLWKAAAVLILALPGLYLIMNSADRTTTLYATYYTPYQDVVSTRGSQGQSVWNEAMRHYNKGAYQQAWEVMSQFSDELKSLAPYLLYAGIIHLELGDVEASARYFQRLIDSRDAQFSSYGYWYLSLAQIRLEEYDAAKGTLEVLTTQEGFFSEKAEKILQDL